MKCDSLPKVLRTVGILLIVVSIVRSVTLMDVFCRWEEESSGFWKEKWTASKIACAPEVVDAVCFSRVTAEVVRSRVLSRYYDECDSLPTTLGIIAGAVLCLCAKLIEMKNGKRSGCFTQSPKPSQLPSCTQ